MMTSFRNSGISGETPPSRAQAREERKPSRLGQLAWRHRDRLAPLAAPLALVTAAGTGYDLAPASWPLAIPVGLATTTVAMLRLDRSSERVYAAAVGLGGTAWATVAWAVSPFHGWLLLPLAAGSLIAAVPWRWHRRQRLPVEVETRSLRELLDVHGLVGAIWRLPSHAWTCWREHRRAHRLLKDYQARWTDLLVLTRLYGSEVTRLSRHGNELLLHVDLAPGQLIRDLEFVSDRIASAFSKWGVLHGQLRVEPGARPHQAILRFVEEAKSPLEEVLPWPGPRGSSVKDPIPLGTFVDGEEVHLPASEHVLIAGLVGYGKSGILNVIIASLSACPDVEIWGVDPKGGVEFGAWEPALHRLVSNAEEADALLADAIAEMERRYELLRAEGLRFWRPSKERPALVVIIDEAAELSERAKHRLERLVSVGRAAGIRCLVCTQRPSAAKLGGTRDLSSQLGVQLSVRLRYASDSEMVFGDRRWRPDRLTLPGAFLIRAVNAGLDNPDRPAKAYWLSDDDVRAFAKRHAVVRPQPAARQEPGRDEPGPTLSLLSSGSESHSPPEVEWPLLRVLDQESRDVGTRILEAFQAAPPGGLRPVALAEELGIAASTVYSWLNVFKATGQVVRVGRGRWRGAGGQAASFQSLLRVQGAENKFQQGR